MGAKNASNVAKLPKGDQRRPKATSPSAYETLSLALMELAHHK